MVYAGIVASTTIITLGAFITSRTLGAMTGDIGRLDALVFLAGLGALGAGFRRRARLVNHDAGRVPELWWGENAGRVLVVWVLMELGGVIGAVLLFATGRAPVSAILAVLALAGLALSSPGRLSRG